MGKRNVNGSGAIIETGLLEIVISASVVNIHAVVKKKGEITTIVQVGERLIGEVIS